jgi:tRNA (cmo5U34)-methyltransferase
LGLFSYGCAVSQFHFTPEHYLESMLEEIPDYMRLQEETARATADVDAAEILELGVGTGETARRVLDLHPGARLTGVDESPPMLERARTVVPGASLVVGRLQDPLPPYSYDLVVTALVVHHLTPAEKRDLFGRVAGVLRPGGRFVLADVVVPDDPADAVTPIEAGYDLPDRLDDQLGWLREAGLEPEVRWSSRDLAVVAATPLRASRASPDRARAAG